MEEEKKCKRPGCGKPYKESDNSATSCKFHNGKPIFHDTKKGWECCNKIVYDWDEFEKLEGCCIGKHSDVKEETEFWKSNTVSHAENALDKEQAKIKTAADFNKEEELKKANENKESEEDKVPVVKDGKYACANKGCVDRYFTEEENHDEACKHHSGEPIFHDTKKGWT